MSDNLISLKAHRTLKECRSLFQGYHTRLLRGDIELRQELERYRKEAENYPHHLLTVVKGEILMSILKERATTEEEKAFAISEERRLKTEVYNRLYKEFEQKGQVS